jgi:hypothetical protein
VKGDGMAKAGYGTSTEGAVALAAGVAKSILGVNGPAQFGVNLKNFSVSFDGVTPTAVPVLIEICYATFATNPPGTASTASTVDQRYGRAITAGFAAAKNWTTEPTVLTAHAEFLLDPNKGLVIYDWPLGEEPDTAVSNGFVMRCNAPAAVNVRASLRFERV